LDGRDCTSADTLKTKVGDVVAFIFEVECTVGGFFILKQVTSIYLFISEVCRVVKLVEKKKAVNAIGLKAAVHDVLTNNISLRDAARLPSISKSTLARHIKLHS
jgi:hypothetical protein